MLHTPSTSPILSRPLDEEKGSADDEWSEFVGEREGRDSPEVLNVIRSVDGKEIYYIAIVDIFTVYGVQVGYVCVY